MLSLSDNRIRIVSCLVFTLWSTPVFAEDPFLTIECLCISPDSKMAVGLTAKKWDDLSAAYSDILQNKMVVILAPSETPGDRQKQACAKWAEMNGSSKTPYAPSAEPVRVKFGGMLKFTPESTYQTAIRGSAL
jgi:hypothetical protein